MVEIQEIVGESYERANRDMAAVEERMCRKAEDISTR